MPQRGRRRGWVFGVGLVALTWYHDVAVVSGIHWPSKATGVANLMAQLGRKKQEAQERRERGRLSAWVAWIKHIEKRYTNKEGQQSVSDNDTLIMATSSEPLPDVLFTVYLQLTHPTLGAHLRLSHFSSCSFRSIETWSWGQSAATRAGQQFDSSI